MVSKVVSQSNLHLIYLCSLAKTCRCISSQKRAFCQQQIHSLSPPPMLYIYRLVHLLLVYFVSSAPIVNLPVYLHLQHKVMGLSCAKTCFFYQTLRSTAQVCSVGVSWSLWPVGQLWLVTDSDPIQSCQHSLMMSSGWLVFFQNMLHHLLRQL